jgi:drug/metabolite transporter (DMT)-like permease
VSRRGWLLFGAMGLIWGIPYLLIRVAVRDFPPGTLVFARTAVGAALLTPLAIRRGVFRPLLSRWRIVLGYTASCSLAGLLIASVPLIGAIILSFLPNDRHDERLTTTRIIGLAIGIGGVGLLMGVDLSSRDVWSVVEMCVTAIGYAVGPIIIARRLSTLPSLGVVTASLLVTAVAYAPYAVTHWPAHVSAAAGWSVAGLGVICTAIAFLLFFALIDEVGPGRATVVTYVNPAVAVLLGVGVLGERFTLGIALGFPLILLGCVLATRRAGPSLGDELVVPEIAEP